MDFDDMLEELGELGTFQISTYLLICLPVLFAAANSLSYVFTAGVPVYRCFIPVCDDPIEPYFHKFWLHHAIPNNKFGPVLNYYFPSQCEMFQPTETARNLTNIRHCPLQYFTKEIVQCDRWVFDGERTIVTDFKITCPENQWKLSLIGTMHFAGIIVGSALFGVLADRYGRKVIFIICIVIMAVSGTAQAVSPEYVTFVVLIFVNSIGTAGVYPLAFIIGVELVGRKKRETTGIVLNYFYALGEAMVALIAWLTEDWVYTQLYVSAPCILFIGYYWLIPESVRWLLAKQKDEKAKRVVCKAAKMNGVTLSDALLDSFDISEQPKGDKYTEPRNTDILPVVRIMLRSNKLVWRFIVVLFIWATNAFVYYGLSLNSTSMVGNKYINFALVCLIEIPGYTLAWISIQYLGRRISLIGSLFLCSVSCFASVCVPTGTTWAVILLFLVGKLGITSSFGVVYVHTAELLPTTVRSAGVGAASTSARFGALLAPFVPLLGNYFQTLPMILFGTFAMIAGLLALILPETLGEKLPESPEEALKL